MIKALLYLSIVVAYSILLDRFGKFQIYELFGNQLFAHYIFMIVFLLPVATLTALAVVEFKKSKLKAKRPNIDKTQYKELWKGKLPLKSAFWIYFFPGSLFFFFVIKSFLSSLILGSTIADKLLVNAVAILLFAYQICSSIGTWRSCMIYDGSKVWKDITKAAIIVVSFGLLIQIYLLLGR